MPRPAERSTTRWTQLAAAIVAMMAIANVQYAWTLFVLPIAEELNASLSSVQIAFTVFILVETWLLPFEGYLIDRWGASRIVALGGVLVGLAWVGSGLAQSLAQLYFWYAVGGTGAGAVYGACIGTALKCFPDRRGLAAGLAAGAYGFGTALTVMPIHHTIATQGYRAAFIGWGIAQGSVVLLAARLMARRPDDWTAAVPARAASGVVGTVVSKTPLEMIRTGTFWLMYTMMTMVAFGGLMVTAQLAPIARSHGMDRASLWFGVSAMGLALVLDRIVNGVTRPVWGWVSDRIGRYDTMAIAFTLEAAAICALMSLIDRPAWFVILSALVFFAWGEIYSLFPAAIADVFGPEYATANYGVQYTAKGTASIFAGWGAAALVETTGSWAPVFWLAAALDLLAAAAAFFWLRPLAVGRRVDAAPRLRTSPEPVA
jgi:MFS transporter, OFA family, oxalate/formate antiporter